MSRTRVTLALGATLAVAALVSGGLPASTAATPGAAVDDHLKRLLQGADSGDFPDAEVPIGDEDNRGPRLPHLATSVKAVKALGHDIDVSSWTRYGTPLSVFRGEDYLATGLTGSPVAIARSYLREHAAVWGLSATDVDGLVPVETGALSQSSTAYSISFNQKVNGILVAQDGYVVVGVVGDKVAGVTSSLVPTALLGSVASTTPKISVQQAVVSAAHDAGINTLKTSDLRLEKVVGGLQQVFAKGLHQLQYTRVRVLPTTDRGARLVYETAVQDVAGGRSLAVDSMVDGITGKVLYRHDGVQTLADSTSGVVGEQSISTIESTAPTAPTTLTAPTALTAPAATQGTPAGTLQGTYGKTCSAPATLDLTAGDQTLAVTAASENVSDDITLAVFRNGTNIGNFDTATSPEAGDVILSPAFKATGDKVTMEVCPFDPKTETGQVQWVGSYTATSAGVPAADIPAPLIDGTQTGPATWRAFASNPQLALPGKVSPDDRYEVCSGAPGGTNVLGKDLKACNYVYGAVGKTDSTVGSNGAANPGFPSPYAYDISPAGASLNTTQGNNDLVTNAQLSSSLTAGAPAVPPTGGGTRTYGFSGLDTFKDTWHKALCNPTSILPPQSADVNAAIINLFVGHNRIHDFSYRLGLTEARGALQLSNYGKANGVPNVMAADPETGNAQNAALTNDAFTVTNQVTGPAAGVGLTGRDNANQITLMDGVPGITNQYLFQPIVGFYGPCVDGDLDASVFLHEYTHAISNRLIAGPATSLSGQQGGSMGESWSDLDAIEYLNAFGLAGSRGEDPYAEGAYATGNKEIGIRDYNLAPSKTPLNYSDFGFDTTGPEVHADGEVWNAVQMTVRQALINKYNAQYPYSDLALRKACALGVTAAGKPGPTWNHCAGDRRYITYLYDALINQANGAPSMVDMRDAEMISVMMRDPSDYDTVYNAFASRGLGLGASSKSSDDLNPVPSFAAAKQKYNAHVTFKLVDANTGKPVKGQVFVGMYSARARPIATTLGGKLPDAKIDIIGGTYVLTVQGKGYGLQRFNVSYTAGKTTTEVLKLSQNLASSAYAPSITGNDGGARLGNIIDDNEATNGAFTGQPVAGRTVTVTFATGKQTFQKLGFSALHHPAATLPEGGTEVEGRLLGIHSFLLQASGDGGKTYRTVYTSPQQFFPTSHPRAVAPELLFRSVTLPKPITADAVRLVVKSNTCTGSADFNHEQEDDATNPSDCRSTATNATTVTITELEVFKAQSSKGAVIITPVKTPSTPVAVAGGGTLAATGASTTLGLGGFALLGFAGAFLVLRRRDARA